MKRPSPARTFAAFSTAALALGLVSFAGCSSKDSTSSQSGSTAGAAATDAAGAAASDAPPASGSADVPVYPGAAKTPVKKMPDVTMCGHHLKIASYDTADDAKTVIAWYKDHVSGGTVVNSAAESDPDSSAADSTTGEILTPGGANAVVVTQMTFKTAGLQAAAKTIGEDKTSIGIETFVPPLGQEYIDTSVAATSKDPAAVAAAKTKLAAMCPNG